METWQTSPSTSIPCALSFSAASSTFFYDQPKNKSISYKEKDRPPAPIKLIKAELDSTCFREEMTTEAPSQPRRSAMAKPMPWVEAVTMATLPRNLGGFVMVDIRENEAEWEGRRGKRKSLVCCVGRSNIY